MRAVAVGRDRSGRVFAAAAAVAVGVACAVPLTAGPAAAQGVLTRGGPWGYGSSGG